MLVSSCVDGNESGRAFVARRQVDGVLKVRTDMDSLRRHDHDELAIIIEVLMAAAAAQFPCLAWEP